MNRSLLPSLVQQFFTDRLCTQMNASPNTIAGYRDTFRLLLRYASEKIGKSPTKLAVEDLGVELVASQPVTRHVALARLQHPGAADRDTAADAGAVDAEHAAAAYRSSSRYSSARRERSAGEPQRGVS